MKKSLSVLLAVLLVFSFALTGCKTAEQQQEVQQKMTEFVDTAKDVQDTVEETVSEVVDTVEENVDEVKDAVEEKVDEVKDTVEETVAEVKDTVEEKVDEVKDAVEEAKAEGEAAVEEAKTEAEAAVEEVTDKVEETVAEGEAAVEEAKTEAEAAVEEAAATVEETVAEGEAAVEEAKAETEAAVEEAAAAVEEAKAEAEATVEEAAATVEEAVAEATTEEAEVWHLGILVHSLDNEFWAQEAKGGELFADSKDDVEAQVLATDGDDNKEMQAMRDFIAQYGDHSIFVTDPASKANTANVVEIAEEAGAKVAILWHHADELEPKDFSSFVVHMSPDDFVAGYNTAKYLFDKLGGKGKVCALYGQQGEDSAANRYAGFQAALAEYPEVEMLDMQVASWSQDQAMTFTQTWLSTYEQIDAIWAANDTMGLGAIEALKLEGKNGQVLVCGCDGIAAAYEAIEAGDMACTVANNGYLLMGYGASYAYQAAKNGLEVENPVVKTQAVLVTTENVAEYKAMFIDGTPEYDFDDLSFCVLSEHPSFAELAAAAE